MRAGGAARRPLSFAADWVILASFSTAFLASVSPMEINPIVTSIKDLTSRTQTIRGYL